MLNFYRKLSLVVLSVALTLGLSSVAVAKSDIIITNWLAAKKKLDCPTTKKIGLRVTLNFDEHFYSDPELFFDWLSQLAVF